MNCITKEYSWLIGMLHHKHNPKTGGWDRIGIHGYGKKSAFEFLKNHAAMSPCVKTLVAYCNDKLQAEVKGPSGSYLNETKTIRLPGANLEKLAVYYQAYGHVIEQAVKESKPSDPLRFVAGGIQIAVLMAHRPEQFVNWFREALHNPLMVNGTSMHEQSADSFMHSLYTLMHKRITALSSADATGTPVQFDKGYTVSVLRMQPSIGHRAN